MEGLKMVFNHAVRGLVFALLVGAGFVSGVAASPPPAPMSAAGCRKIFQNNGTWIASACPVSGKLGNNVVGIDLYYWGYLADQQLPFGGLTPTIQAVVESGRSQWNQPLNRDSGIYYNKPVNGDFFYGRYLTALPLSGSVDMDLTFQFNGKEDSNYCRGYRVVIDF
jgi:hypothetical protein